MTLLTIDIQNQGLPKKRLQATYRLTIDILSSDPRKDDLYIIYIEYLHSVYVLCKLLNAHTLSLQTNYKLRLFLNHLNIVQIVCKPHLQNMSMTVYTLFT